MSDDYILAPMQLDAMVLTKPVSEKISFLRYEMDYENLGKFTSPEPRPFYEKNYPDPPDAGIYLHWTLPQALRHGTAPDDSSDFSFHLVPNRWLVVRVLDGATPDQAVKAWLLYSDHLGSDGSSNYVHPTQTNADGSPVATKIGRNQPLSDPPTGTEQTNSFLTALGPGDLTFSTFSPSAEDVLSFCDRDVADLPKGTFTYYVAGWHADPSDDPLATTEWESDPDQPGIYANDTFDWYVYADDDDLPKQTLIHALVSGVDWDPTSENVDPDSYPQNLSAQVKVAVGNTAIDALSAIVRVDNPTEQKEADLLEAFQYGLLDNYDQPGGPETLNMDIRQHWFGASSGGTLWSIVATEREGSTALPAPSTPVLTDDQKDQLATLNQKQHELDRQQRILESMQWTLFSLWWKYKWQQVGNSPPFDPGEFTDFLGAQLACQVGDWSGAGCDNAPDQTDPAWYINQVKAQTSTVSQASSDCGAAQTAVTLGDDQKLKAVNMPQYYHPNDPVVLALNLGRSDHLDPTGSLLCRTPAQMMSALTVSDTTYCATGSSGTNIGDKIPVLADPNSYIDAGVLPSIQQLNVESFFLSPCLFAQDILGDESQADAVRAAYEALPDPAADIQFAPQDVAYPEWTQPWRPLLLEWQATVLKEPAYTCPTDSVLPCTFNQSNWQFDGTDFQWPGDATHSDSPDFHFDEDDSVQMQLSGRTFITPHLPVTLASQLQDWINTHQQRDPDFDDLVADLETYLKTIQGQDILSQRLSGMTALMIQRDYVANAAPFGTDITDVLGDYHHGYPSPNLHKHYSSATTPWDFAALRGTFFVIDKLTVLDNFGRTIDLMGSNNSAYSGQDEIADYFYPYAGRNLKFKTATDPTPAPSTQLPASEDPTKHMMQLPPRITQDSKLAFDLTSNDTNNDNINYANANPICGWVVPNHLDRSLAIYGPDGTAWGELYLSQQDEDHYVPVWQSDPTSDSPIASVEDIPNVYVANMLQALCERSETDDGLGFSGFFQVIDETLWSVNPRGRRQDQNLSVLVGRPLAIVRAELQLKLRGLPYVSQDWWNIFDVSEVFPPDPGDYCKPAAFKKVTDVDGGVGDFKWDIHLGSQALNDDGLIGYYVDDPSDLASSFGVFNAVHVPDDVQTDYLDKIEPGNFIDLYFTDDTVTTPDSAEAQVCRLTMLVDPRGSVHAFTGLLPVFTLDIPGEYTTAALAKMAYMFRIGPFLTSPDVVRIPQPAESKGTWSWFDKVLDAASDITKADGKVRFPTTPPLVKEGWLKFTPNPSTDEQE